jgi:peroxiredoxin
VLAATTPALAADRAAPVPVGESAPDVALADQHGKPFQLAEALKQRDFVVLAFYVKAFTGG